MMSAFNQWARGDYKTPLQWWIILEVYNRDYLGEPDAEHKKKRGQSREYAILVELLLIYTERR